MRLALLVAALPLTGAIPQDLPGKRAVGATDPKWDGPPYDPNDDGPPYDSKDDEPRRNLGSSGTVLGKANGSTNNQSMTTPKQTTSISSSATADGNFSVTILAYSNRDGKVDVTGETDLVSKYTWTSESGALFLANIVDTDRRCSSQITGSCASKLSDFLLLGNSLPEKHNEPEIDPEILFKQITGSKLTESEEAQYNEWEAQHNQWEKQAHEYEEALRERRWKANTDERISACHDSSDDVLRNSTYLAPLRTKPTPGLSDLATGSIAVTNEIGAPKVRLFHKTGDEWISVASNYTFKAQDLRVGLELGIDGSDATL